MVTNRWISRACPSIVSPGKVVVNGIPACPSVENPGYVLKVEPIGGDAGVEGLLKTVEFTIFCSHVEVRKSPSKASD